MPLAMTQRGLPLGEAIDLASDGIRMVEMRAFRPPVLQFRQSEGLTVPLH